jgi:hypothetical protein
MAARLPKNLAPTWPQDCPRTWLRDCREMAQDAAQDAPRCSPRCSKMRPRCSKMRPKRIQNGPTAGPTQSESSLRHTNRFTFC